MDVKRVSALANLPLSEAELAKYGPQLNKILDYVDQLQKTDTSQVAETSQVTNLKNVGRPDRVEKYPPLIEGYVKVKAIFDHD